jgi:hypothetical protein
MYTFNAPDVLYKKPPLQYPLHPISAVIAVVFTVQRKISEKLIYILLFGIGTITEISLVVVNAKVLIILSESSK